LRVGDWDALLADTDEGDGVIAVTINDWLVLMEVME
jgi:hypothetical protein